MKTRLRTTMLIAVLAAAMVPAVQAVSLYQKNGYQALVSDRKAHQVGDVLTVVVYENSSATSAANTTAGRDADVGFDARMPGTSGAGSVKLNNNLDGRGRTQREGSVLAQITVSVQGVADNGDLFIAGQQFVEVNNERQQIRVEGRVRLQDISNTNTVQSTRVADARISYIGDGDLSDKQRPAWWQRVLTWFGL